MDVKIKKNDFPEIAFTFGWILMVIHFSISYSALSNLSSPFVSMIALLLFIFKILKTKYTQKELLLGLSIVIIGLIAWEKAKDMRVLWFSIVIFSMKRVNIEKIINVTYYTILICVIAILFFCYIGLTTDFIPNMSDGRVRHSYGFQHPNTLQAFVLYIVIMTIYINYEKLKFQSVIILLMISVVFYKYTISRTGIIVTGMVLALAVWIRFFSGKYFNNSLIVLFGYLYICVFTVLPIVYYKINNSYLTMLNSLLNRRISQAAFFYSAYGIKLFGNYLLELSYDTKPIYLDMGFSKMLFNNGIIYYLMIVGGTMVLLVRYLKRKNYKKIFLLISFILFLGTENVATYIFMNVSMLFLSELVFSESSEGKIIKQEYNC